jgi:hypothetical protein
MEKSLVGKGIKKPFLRKTEIVEAISNPMQKGLVPMPLID